MPPQPPSVLSPVEEYEQQLDRRRDRARFRIRMSVVSWCVLQAFALTDLGLGVLLRERYDSDAAVTTTMIWLVSVPCGLGALVFTLRAWPLLGRGTVAVGLAPWFITVAEATAVPLAWRFF